MAFATRHLRILCKIYSGSRIATFSTLRPPVTRITLVKSTQNYRYSTEPIRPKITGSLTNIQSTTTPIEAKPTSDQNKQNENDEDPEKKDGEKKGTAYTPFMKFCMAFFGIWMGGVGSYMIYELARPNYDEEGNVIEDEFTHLPYMEQMFKRLLRELNYYKKLVQEPSRDKLLPDPLKYPYIQPQYTLVLELIDLLVHPDWTYQTGWRFKKRPGVDQFLESVAPPQFEIVVFTAEHGMTVFPILDALDPQGYIMYRLVRDATRFVDGQHVKDLSALNRDLSKVIVVDWNGDSVKYHPENVLKLPRWTGNDDDTTMYDLAAFLKTIHVSQVDDVRDVLNYYRQFENPLEAFRENQRKLLVQMEEDEVKQKDATRDLTSRWKPSFLRNR
ncbi:mitochondrial import inner membrane translocase subunit TIM50-C-like [Belonocnema kinseyi]|uniref:mitochondrial import inner membrane translocase subunit TIM50-C-like n=1 Tax=Belonocnema kinseyi TaxID=2817044 RepID=UPI00143DE641|nr:mitochondrial import inner membrane translocase subunit TIM50-C-like [Belonocnema kinseyi]